MKIDSPNHIWRLKDTPNLQALELRADRETPILQVIARGPSVYTLTIDEARWLNAALGEALAKAESKPFTEQPPETSQEAFTVDQPAQSLRACSCPFCTALRTTKISL